MKLAFLSRFRFRPVFLGLPFVLALALSPLAFKAIARRLVERALAPQNGAASSLKSCLIVGLDDSGKRADMIAIAFPQSASSSAVLLVLPRDCEIGKGRKLNGLWQQGQGVFKARVESLIGQKIDGVMAISFPKLKPVLEAAFPDGLSVPVPYRLKYADKAAGFAYNIPAGRQTLNSDGLMALLRDRYSDPLKRGEAARVANWRRFLIEARGELTSPRGLIRLPELAQQSQSVFQTDLSQEKLQWILFTLVKSSDLRFSYLPSKSYYQNKKWFTKLDEAAARSQVRLAVQGISIPKNVQIWVVNATTKAGLAHKISKPLRSDLGVPVMTGDGPLLAASRVEYSDPEAQALSQQIVARLKREGVKVEAPQPLLDKRNAAHKTAFPTIVVRLGRNAV